ncbi:protein OS-9, partial [Ixodes scapularis]|uniref:protein OS-9 n=1 Tax=Ixodes scapularis TaxID=6945 RepID=UPI001A9ED280
PFQLLRLLSFLSSLLPDLLGLRVIPEFVLVCATHHSVGADAMIFTATFLVISSHLAVGLLNLEELRSFNYEVDIVSTPVKIGHDMGQSVMLMTTKFGQEYQCSLPEKPVGSESAESSDGEEEASNVIKLLEPLRSLPCLTKTKNWWTYELCYGKSIKQFHLENGVPDAVIYLGLYESDFDWNDETNLEQLNKTGQQKYHSQKYTRGTVCDITGAPRKVEVRYYCDEDSTDYIFSVEEPETCSYVFTVHTSRVCSFPPLRRLSTSRPHTISCSPLLSEEQYQKYLEVRENEKKLEEEKRKKWLVEQQKNLEAIKSFAKKQPLESLSNPDKTETTPVQNEPEQQLDLRLKETEEVTEDSKNAVENVPDSSKPEQVGLLDEEKEAADLMRESLKKDFAKQFKDLFNEEAEGELQDEAYEQFKEKTYLKLDSTIERLMKRMKQAEALVPDEIDAKVAVVDLDENRKGHKAHHQDVEKEQDSPEGDEEGDNNEGYDEASEPLPGEEGEELDTSGESQGQDEESGLEDGPLSLEESSGKDARDKEGSVRVRIRRFSRRKPTDQGERATSFQEQDLPAEDKSRLESALKERLQKAGVDTTGRKIEVKIITAGYYDDEDNKGITVLSPEETTHFQNMIVTLLMGNQEAVQEIEKHERLERNYQFVWDEERRKSSSALPAMEAEEDDR